MIIPLSLGVYDMAVCCNWGQVVEVFYLSHCKCDSHWCHFDFKLVFQAFSSMHFLIFYTNKSVLLLITESWAFVTHAEGQSDESVPSQICSLSNTWHV